MDIERIADYACRNAESPLWHPGEQKLYWGDIPNKRMYRYDPRTGDSELCYEGDTVGGFTIQADGALLLLMPRGAARTWRDGFVETLLEEIPDERETRFKDCVADPMGRVFVGTVSRPERPGRVYRLDLDGTPTCVMENVRGSNGMGYTPDRSGMYITDSATGIIHLFDYDEASGEIANGRPWVVIPAEEGVPDGMTVDAEGCIWSARWGGHCVVRFDPDGREMTRIEFPAQKVSSCTFGGAEYEDLYVTTAGGPNRAEEGPGAGAVFRVRPGVRGVAEFASKVGIDA